MKWIIRHTEQIDNIVGKQIVMSFYLFSCLDFILYNHKYILIKFVIKSSIKMLEPGLPAFSYIASVVFWNLVVFSNFLGIIYILRNRPTRAQTTS